MIGRTQRTKRIYSNQPAADFRTARYRSSLTTCGLKVAESRIVADLLLRNVCGPDWRKEIVSNNVLQYRSRNSADRIGQFLRARLMLMQPELWRMVRDGSTVTSTHACFAAAVKHSPLLGDFLDLVVRERYQLFRQALSVPDWEHYVDDCHSRDPGMSEWSESTISRLRSIVFAILAEIGYINNVRARELQTVHIATEVLNYLQAESEEYVLRCIGVQP